METINAHAYAATATSAPTLIRRIQNALNARRSRAQLAQLDQSRLEDLGITSVQAQNEANRPIWDVPAHWHR